MCQQSPLLLSQKAEQISCVSQAHASATQIQAVVRGMLARARLQEANKAAVKLQAAWRAFAQRRRNLVALQSQGRERAAVLIQACYRGLRERKRRQAEARAATTLQAFWKMRLQRQRYITTLSDLPLPVPKSPSPA